MINEAVMVNDYVFVKNCVFVCKAILLCCILKKNAALMFKEGRTNLVIYFLRKK